MTQRSGVFLLGLLLVGCAPGRVAPRSAPEPVVAPPAVAAESSRAISEQPAAATSPSSQTKAPSRKDSTIGNAALSFDRRAASDSLADAAALAALNDTSALSALPALSIDDTPAFDLNVTAFATQPRVQYYVDYFTGRGRERFQIWLDRMPRYESFVRDRLVENKLPGDLVYLALIESGFSNSAVSTASAVGMWQFMAPTGRGYGLRVDGWLDERRDPIKATGAAARHLRDLTERFGSYYLAAAAYNAGAGKVGRGLNKLGPTPEADSGDVEDLSSGDSFFSLADTRLIAQETKDYVPKLIAAALIAKAPMQYGFGAVAAPVPFPLDSFMVAGGTGLDLMARLADTTLDALRELNPHLLRLVTPPAMTSYPVRLPAGTAALVADRYAAVRPEDRLALTTWKVKAGETVASIATSSGADADDIRTVNRAARSGKLSAGTVLYIPHTTIPISLLRDVGATTSSVTHLVKSGETLGGIARRYGTTVTALRSNNHLKSNSMIRVGQRLNVASRVVSVASSVPKVSSSARSTVLAKSAPKSVASSKSLPASSAKVHVVRAGETISEIAEHYGVNQARMVSLNGLGKSRKIYVGQRLKLPA